MAIARPSQHTGRGFGLQKAMHVVERGVQGIMAVKGAYDTGRQLYTLARAAAPIITSSLALL